MRLVRHNHRPLISSQSIVLKQMLQGLYSVLFKKSVLTLLLSDTPGGKLTSLLLTFPQEMLVKVFSRAPCPLFPVSGLPPYRKRNFTDSIAKETWNTWEGVSPPLESAFFLHCAKSLVRKLGDQFNWERADYVRMSVWLLLPSPLSVIKVIYWSPYPWLSIYLWNGSKHKPRKSNAIYAHSKTPMKVLNKCLRMREIN